jgi:hypothetical protein
MTKREPKTVRIDPEVWDSFVSWVVETEGQKKGELGRHVENALSEYIDHGRDARIEEKVDRILTHVSEPSDAHTHTSTRASEAVEKAREIHQRVADNHGTMIRQDDLQRAIEDIAGADDRTIQKYEELLKRRGLLFRHPDDSPVWTVERERWLTWCENYVDNNPTVEIHDVIEGYSMDVDKYDELVEATL